MKTFAERTFAIVDVETTGGSPVGDRVIEIAVIRVEDGKIAASFKSLVNPLCSVSPFITGITGIRTEDLVDAPTFDEIANDVRELLSGAVFVAHNARFDYSFVKNELRRLDTDYQAKCLCSVRLSRKLYPSFKHHDLSSVIDRFGLACESRHRAYDDAKAVFDFMTIARNENAGRFDDAVHELLGRGTASQYMKKDILADLPDSPGVYIFYGPEGETLYVGKSVNIKTRVMSHFSGDVSSGKEMTMCQQVASVETRQTAGELGALILESELIKSMMPLYNRVSRKKRRLFVARHACDAAGYSTAVLEEVDRIEPDGSHEILGLFKSRAQARSVLSELCDEYGLCPKVMGIEKMRGACFGSQIGKCSGACSGKARPEEYNAAFNEAFAERRVKAWPFKGAVMIDEKGDDGASEAFVIDGWCLVARLKGSADGSVETREYPPYFDYDTYKILARHLTDHKNTRSIRKLSDIEFDSVFADA